MSKKYVESVNKKTIDWWTLIDNEIGFFSNNQRRPTLVDLLENTMEQNQSRGFKGEDLEVKKRIDNLCRSLITKYEAGDSDSLVFYRELIGLGEYLFSSNHQHFDVAQKLGIASNEATKKKSENQSVSTNTDRGKTTRESIIELYMKLKQTNDEREIASIIANRINKSADYVRRIIKNLKKSNQL
jgi:hypothetical protein